METAAKDAAGLMPDAVEEVVKRVHKAVDKVDRLASVDASTGARSHSNINVNAGGVGVWIAATCCAVMLASGLIAAMWISREFTRLDRENDARREEAMRMQSYLSAIYVRAPELNPDTKKAD